MRPSTKTRRKITFLLKKIFKETYGLSVKVQLEKRISGEVWNVYNVPNEIAYAWEFPESIKKLFKDMGYWTGTLAIKFYE